MKENCTKCVYAGRAEEAGRKILICTNMPGKEGELVVTGEERLCDNYRKRREPALRLEPPAPPAEEIRYIALTKGKFAIVDKEDYEWLGRFKWFTSGPEKYPYAIRATYPEKGVKITSYMHRMIMNAPKGMVVDHINGNTLDNRRANLRLATKRQNTCNMRVNKEGCSSKYRGVGWHKASKKWIAKITVNMKRIHLGLFDDEIKAAKAYDEAAKKYYEEFARVNLQESEDSLEIRSPKSETNSNDQKRKI